MGVAVKWMSEAVQGALAFKFGLFVLAVVATVIVGFFTLFFDTIGPFVMRNTYEIRSIVPLVSYEESAKAFAGQVEHGFFNGSPASCTVGFKSGVGEGLKEGPITQITMSIYPGSKDSPIRISSANRVVAVYFHGTSPNDVCFGEGLKTFEIGSLRHPQDLTILYTGTVGDVSIQGFVKRTKRLEAILIVVCIALFMALVAAIILSWLGRVGIQRTQSEISLNSQSINSNCELLYELKGYVSGQQTQLNQLFEALLKLDDDFKKKVKSQLDTLKEDRPSEENMDEHLNRVFEREKADGKKRRGAGQKESWKDLRNILRSGTPPTTGK